MSTYGGIDNQSNILFRQVKVHRYWPGKAPTAIANLVVEMTQEKTFDDYIMREFKVTNTGVGSMPVTH